MVGLADFRTFVLNGDFLNSPFQQPKTDCSDWTAAIPVSLNAALSTVLCPPAPLTSNHRSLGFTRGDEQKESPSLAEFAD